MSTLNSSQRKELRSLAHHLDPIVLIGAKGVTATVITSVDQALEAHELIKIKFNDFKDAKKELTEEIAESTSCEIAGIIGHVATLYRQHRDPKKRGIELPD